MPASRRLRSLRDHLCAAAEPAERSHLCADAAAAAEPAEPSPAPLESRSSQRPRHTNDAPKLFDDAPDVGSWARWGHLDAQPAATGPYGILDAPAGAVAHGYDDL